MSVSKGYGKRGRPTNEERMRRAIAEQRLRNIRRLLQERYVMWARESINSYLRYKMEGKAHNVATSARSYNPAGFEKQSLDEVIGDREYGLPMDFDYRNYLEVSGWLSSYLRENPQDWPLEKLLEHTRYSRKPLDLFQVMASPFSLQLVSLRKLGPSGIAQAEGALCRFEVYVAKMKEHQAWQGVEGRRLAKKIASEVAPVKKAC
jgi:hypothetical protein